MLSQVRTRYFNLPDLCRVGGGNGGVSVTKHTNYIKNKPTNYIKKNNATTRSLPVQKYKKKRKKDNVSFMILINPRIFTLKQMIIKYSYEY